MLVYPFKPSFQTIEWNLIPTYSIQVSLLWTRKFFQIFNNYKKTTHNKVSIKILDEKQCDLKLLEISWN